MMKFKRLTTEVGEGSLQMFSDEMFVEVFELNIMVVFVVMEMVKENDATLTRKLKESKEHCKESDTNVQLLKAQVHRAVLDAHNGVISTMKPGAN
ncbi:hypothetical protein CMV_024886 [Castanea mollissima]|uniref:Uncharacterized protein n=1 Tax=Castanea mollissima TaxID=60419 RepID=A0A8J4QLU4_9ROSI|nr:hypothetical protein CMV_024886 [Castanea mollissima]